MRKVITPVNSEGRAALGIRSGDTVRVVQNIIEMKKGRGTDKKEKTTKNARKQTFEGLVLSTKHGKEAGGMFTVRATLSGIGVEKTFPLYSPVIDSIEIVKRSRVRRAKLYFIREKAAKQVRRQLRNARMLNLKSDETLPVEEVAPEAVITEAEVVETATLVEAAPEEVVEAKAE
ncbi:MAG: ribosomal protein large subunit ribosomal protein [Parcubacteria group bacterium]|nr:ribosomal protein large subunit ribosomal protein [Parcubacteria group bacterium]